VVDPASATGADNCGRFALFDYRRSLETDARSQAVAIIHWSLNEATRLGKVGKALPFERVSGCLTTARRRIPKVFTVLRYPNLRRGRRNAQPPVERFYRARADAHMVERAVGLIEALH